MKITRNSARGSTLGPEVNFTGHAVRRPLFTNPEPSKMAGGSVTFAPGARTVWHTHPVGQILIYTSGVGAVQTWGGAVELVEPGDVIWFAPGEKHWHGASAAVGASHIALVETENGVSTDWLEPVTEAQYAHEAAK